MRFRAKHGLNRMPKREVFFGIDAIENGQLDFDRGT